MGTPAHSVLHVASVDDGEALETLCRTTQVIDALGVRQILVILDDGRASDVVWSASLPVEVRPLPVQGLSLLGRIAALRGELSRLAGEALYAVHLHGLGPCLLGTRALRASGLQGRVLYSPHLAHSASPWAVALFTRLVQSHIEAHDCAAVAASLAEAQTLSKLLNRSAEILPYPVGSAFFDAPRREAPRPRILVDGFGAEAVDLASRLSVLLNGREARVSLAWLGSIDATMQAQCQAANVEVAYAAEDAERAEMLSRAWAYVHLAPGRRLSHGVAQAMAAGVPCLVSDTPAHRALVRHGETGFVCTSERDFLETLVLLMRDQEERGRIGEAAREEAERRFTSRHFERAILRAYGLSPAQRARPVVNQGERQAWKQSVG